MISRRLSAVAFAAMFAASSAAQAAPRIGPTFGTELLAAGCADGVSWQDDGTLILMPGVDPSCPNKVLAAHDPTRVASRRASLSALLDPLSPAQRASISGDHMQRLQAEAAEQGGTLPVGNAKVARAASDLGLTPDSWFKLAGR